MRKKYCFFGLITAFTISTTLANVHAFHPNLIAAWTFDEGKGDTTADATGNSHEGTLDGNPNWVDGVNGKDLAMM